MASRPDFIDLRLPAGDVTSRILQGSPSPRIEHFDGEIPPALSPLDAFAAQGRLLARQLDDSMRKDRRLSRLPPTSVARSLSQPRPGYFRSPSSSDQSQESTRSSEQGWNPLVEEPKFRPQSEHPRLSGLSILHSQDGRDDTPRSPRPEENQMKKDYFDARRAESPEADPTLERDSIAASNNHRATSPSRGSSTDSSQPQISTTLAPPVSPMPQSYYKPRYMHPESSDDDYTSSNAGSTFSKPRKLSSSSGVSMPHSPMSPLVRSHAKSPSVSSEASFAGHLPRPSFNFSRPLSRSSTSLSAPSPVIPSDGPVPGPPSNGISRDNKPMPITVPEPERSQSLDDGTPSSAVSSYVYAKYSLPRGRMLSRNSLVFAGLQTPNFEWKEPLFEKSPPSQSGHDRAPSPDRLPKDAPKRIVNTSPPSPPIPEPIFSARVDPVATVPAAPTRQSYDVPRPQSSLHLPPNVLQRSYSANLDDSKSSSADSASTIRPHTGRSTASAVINITAEEHVAKGIECHENGALQESTYHLRIAAKQDHPTGMLLYALACRHGWGMRANQREGVQWLRKAVDSVGLDVDGDDDSKLGGKNATERKARRAQFALGVYELGVSHLNGWGIEQDKSLALRCFEIAGRWGDADALAEAGFCYVEGIGCKKDLKKAANYYRMAEAKGMSMVGNSWSESSFFYNSPRIVADGRLGSTKRST